MTGNAARVMAVSLDHGRLASTGIPRLAPVVVARPRIDSWLARHTQTRGMLLVSPIGFGKTTAVIRFLVAAQTQAGYVRIAATDLPDRLRARVSRLIGGAEAPRCYDDALEQLAGAGPLVLCFDEIERAPDATRSELASMLIDAPANLILVYLSRSRTAIASERAIAKGLADVCDPAMFAFDEEEISQLAAAYGVSARPGDAASLLEVTEGWPIVVSAAIRVAAEQNVSLANAYEAWRASEGRHFPRYVAEELSKASDLDRSVLQLALRGTDISEHDALRLADLEARGLLVRRVGSRCQPFRVLQDLSAPLVSFIADGTGFPVPTLNVRMLGRFDASIGDRPIEWIRRRDQQIFKYLLLQSSGAATRGELLETFWSDTEAQLATQSLRTASSNIRKAIAAIVGQENVARYFSSRGDVGINFNNVTLDTHRFAAVLRDGDAELEAGNTAQALAHYRAAEALYGGGLFAGDAPEPWCLAKAQAYQALYVGLLERLSSLDGTTTRDPLVAARAFGGPAADQARAPEPEAELPPNVYRPSRPLLTSLKQGVRRP